MEDKEEDVENEEDGEEHVYQTLDRRQNSSLTESVYALPLKAKVRNYRRSCYYVHEGFSVACCMLIMLSLKNATIKSIKMIIEPVRGDYWSLD